MAADNNNDDTRFHVLRMESARHMWCKAPGSPCLLRVRLPSPPTAERLLVLSMARPFFPVAVQLDAPLGTDWNEEDRCFDTTACIAWVDAEAARSHQEGGAAAPPPPPSNHTRRRLLLAGGGGGRLASSAS